MKAILLTLLLMLGLVAQAADVRCTLQECCCCADRALDHPDCCRVPSVGPVVLAPPPPLQTCVVTLQVYVVDWPAQTPDPVAPRHRTLSCGLRAPPALSPA